MQIANSIWRMVNPISDLRLLISGSCALLLALCSLLLAPCSSTQAQQPAKVPRIGFLDSSTASGVATLVDAFRQKLGKLGWIEGRI